MLQRLVGFRLGAAQRDDGQLAEPLKRTDVVAEIPAVAGPVVQEAVAERGGQGPALGRFATTDGERPQRRGRPWLGRPCHETAPHPRC